MGPGSEVAVPDPRDVPGAEEWAPPRLLLATAEGSRPEPASSGGAARPSCPSRGARLQRQPMGTTGGELTRLVGLAEDHSAPAPRVPPGS